MSSTTVDFTEILYFLFEGYLGHYLTSLQRGIPSRFYVYISIFRNSSPQWTCAQDYD